MILYRGGGVQGISTQADTLKEKNFLDLYGLSSFWKSIKSKFVSSTSDGSYLKISTGSTQSIDVNQDRLLKGTINTGTKLATDGYVTEQIEENSDETISNIEIYNIVIGEGTLLNIVDANNDEKYLVINFNGFPVSNWPITINDVEYKKDDRNSDRTMNISYTGSVGDEILLRIINTNGEIYSSRKYTIPKVYNVDTKIESVETDELIFVKDCKLSIDGNIKVNRMFVSPTAELEILNGASLTVDSLILRTDKSSSAILSNNGNLSVNNLYYTRVCNDRAYHLFGIPYSVPVSNVYDINLNTKYNMSWTMKSYSESLRAENGTGNSNWVSVSEDSNISVGKGYEIYIGSSYYCELYFQCNLSDIENNDKRVRVEYTNGSAGEAQSGWNLVCSPLMCRCDNTVENLTIYTSDGSDGIITQTPQYINPATAFYFKSITSGYLDFSNNELRFVPDNV